MSESRPRFGLSKPRAFSFALFELSFSFFSFFSLFLLASKSASSLASLLLFLKLVPSSPSRFPLSSGIKSVSSFAVSVLSFVLFSLLLLLFSESFVRFAFVSASRARILSTRPDALSRKRFGAVALIKTLLILVKKLFFKVLIRSFKSLTFCVNTFLLDSILISFATSASFLASSTAFCLRVSILVVVSAIIVSLSFTFKALFLTPNTDDNLVKKDSELVTFDASARFFASSASFKSSTR